jgi:hypothetical protein
MWFHPFKSSFAKAKLLILQPCIFPSEIVIAFYIAGRKSFARSRMDVTDSLNPLILCFFLSFFFTCISVCLTHSYLVALVQANPYWSMMHTNSYKYAYSGAGNYFSHGNVYDVDDYIHRADVGRRIWDNSAPVNNSDSTDVVPQGGEAPRTTTANSTAEECKLKLKSPEVVSFQNAHRLKLFHFRTLIA